MTFIASRLCPQKKKKSGIRFSWFSYAVATDVNDYVCNNVCLKLAKINVHTNNQCIANGKKHLHLCMGY